MVGQPGRLGKIAPDLLALLSIGAYPTCPPPAEQKSPAGAGPVGDVQVLNLFEHFRRSSDKSRDPSGWHDFPIIE